MCFGDKVRELILNMIPENTALGLRMADIKKTGNKSGLKNVRHQLLQNASNNQDQLTTNRDRLDVIQNLYTWQAHIYEYRLWASRHMSYLFEQAFPK